MQIFTATHQGPRSYQEDRYKVVQNDDNSSITAIISDGMGGHPNGDKAAETVVQELLQADLGSEVESSLKALVSALWRADKVCIYSRDYRGATATAIHILGEDLVYVHAGDTRLYIKYANDTKIEQATVDHGYGHRIDNAVGFLKNVEQGTLSTENMELLLLTTDGIHDTLSREDIEGIVTIALRTGLDPALDLVNQAIEFGTNDNCTAIVIQLKE